MDKKVQQPNAARLLSVVALYFLTSHVANSLSGVSGGHAALWPAAGVMFAASLLYGWKGIVAAFIGAVGFLTHIAIDPATSSLEFLQFPDSIPHLFCGLIVMNLLQTLIGSYLVHRFTQFPNEFHSERSLLTFCWWGAVVGSSIAFLILNFIAFSLKFLGVQAFGSNFFIEWVGTVLGVAIVSPIFFLLANWRIEAKDNRPWIVGLPVMAMLCLLLMSTHFMKQSQLDQRTQNVEDKAEHLESVVRQEFRIIEMALLAIGGYFSSNDESAHRHSGNQEHHYHDADDANGTLGFRHFNQLSDPLLRQIATIKGFLWVEDLDGPVITHRSAMLGDYVLNPKNEGQKPKVDSALRKAFNNGEMAVSESIAMMDGGFEFWFVLPIHKTSLPASETIQAYDPSDLIGAAVARVDSERFAASVVNLMEGSGAALRIVDHPVMSENNYELDDLNLNVHVAVADRYWRFIMPLDPLPIFSQWSLWFFSTAGLLVIWLFQLLLFSTTGRRKDIEAQVTYQTLELSRSKRRAELANKAKSEFLANISHELRTPLNSIIGFTVRIINRDDSSMSNRVLESLKIVEKNGRMLLELINDLLDVSKAEAGKMELNLSVINPNQVADDIETQFKSEIEAKGLSFSIQRLESEERFQADPQRVIQVLFNLVANAIKFTNEGGIWIEVEAQEFEGKSGFCFRVRDSGVGIPEGALDTLFDKFVQASNQKDNAYSGTGLGLAIVREIVALHGGDVQVFSELDVGSIFEVWLPLMPINGSKDNVSAI